MIDNSVAEVFACHCKPEDCDYKLQWVEADSPTLVPYDVVTGKIVGKFHLVEEAFFNLFLIV